MSLELDFGMRRGDFVLETCLKVEEGELLAIMGPNGSGKSSLLQAIAGLLPINSGSISCYGRILASAKDKVHLSPQLRKVGLLGQEPLLFPHLTALANVSYGIRELGPARREAAANWLAQVGLEGMEDRKPNQLSGGQKQRVAIARALAAQPEVLLLDEPLASLDVETASAARTLLRQKLREFNKPSILVTHDAVDAIVMADKVAILEEGRLTDLGPVSQVLGKPVRPFAASVAGLNLLSDESTGGRGWMSFPQNAAKLEGAKDALPGKSSRKFSGAIASIEPAAGGVKLRLAQPQISVEIPARELLERRLEIGQPIELTVAGEFVTVYPDRTIRGQ